LDQCVPLGSIDPDVHSRFGILLAIIGMTSIFLTPPIVLMAAIIFPAIVIIPAPAMARKNATGSSGQSDNAY
jgi:hypothetical protein